MRNLKRLCNLPLAAMYISVSLFFLGSLKVPKMVLSYLGISSHITLLAVGIFAVLDAVLLLAVAKSIFKNKQWKPLLVLAVVNFIYLFPYLRHGMLYQLVQYVILMVPFSLCAYLLTTEENGTEKFFRCLQNMSKGIFVFFALYILLLFVAKPGPTGYVEIKELSYGDIAYAALPFLFGDLRLFLTKESKHKLFTCARILVYVATIIYSGTRSTMICMAVALVLQLVLPLTTRKIYAAIFAAAIAACILFCNTVTPAGSRLNVVKGDLLYELGDKNVFDLFDDDQDETTESTEETTESEPDDELIPPDGLPTVFPEDHTLLFNVATRRFEYIDSAFRYHIIHSDRTISETQEILRKDIKEGTGKYLYAVESYRETAAKYSLPINSRVYLWTTAWGEFSDAKLLGKGILHYQNKYESTFPHNVVLELLADFGIAGFVLFFAAIGIMFFYLAIHAWKHKLYGNLAILAFILIYIPMFLLFHSLYFNGVLFFAISYLVLGTVQQKTGKKQFPAEQTNL